MIKSGQAGLSCRIVLFGGLHVQSCRALIVPFDPHALVVKKGKVAFRIRVALLRRLGVERGRRCEVLRYPLAIAVKQAQVELRIRIALLRRLAEPLRGLLIVLRDDRGFHVGNAKLSFSRGVSRARLGQERRVDACCLGEDWGQRGRKNRHESKGLPSHSHRCTWVFATKIANYGFQGGDAAHRNVASQTCPVLIPPQILTELPLSPESSKR